MTQKISLHEALDKVAARFIYNLPESELTRIERLFFHIEQAHWFYEDFIADNYSYLPKFQLKNFAETLFNHCVVLQPLKDQCHVLFDDFCSYRYQIPVCGCIMLNEDMTHMVLVRNWKGSSWSFPKGKINQGEKPFECALRETYEETGFNPAEYCTVNDFVDLHEEKRMTRLFIAVGIPMDTQFAAQTRKEISKIEFQPLKHLPKGVWGVHPFMPKLQRWIKARKRSKPSSNVPEVKDKRDRGKASTPARFDMRNDDTFGGGVDTGYADKGWSVDDMFAANSMLTGKSYTYDGNPHNFGSTHPQYVNYEERAQQKAKSACGNSVLHGNVEDISHLYVPASTSSVKKEESSGTTTLETRNKEYFPCEFRFEVSKVISVVDSTMHKCLKAAK